MRRFGLLVGLCLASLLIPSDVVLPATQDTEIDVAAPLEACVFPSPSYEPNTTYSAVPLPPALAPDELRHYAQLLNLSDAQRKALQTLVQDFCEAELDLRGRQLPELWRMAGETASIGSPIVDPDAAEHLSKLIERCESFIEATFRNEDGIWLALEPLLAEEQLPLLGRVRSQRSIARTTNFLFFTANAAKVDVSSILRTCSGEAARQNEDAREVIAEYESVAAQLRLQHFRSRLRCTKEGPKLLALRNSQSKPASDETFEKFRSLRRRAGQLERRLEQINRTYVELICEILPLADATEFKSKYFEAAYPEVYPNPFDATSVIAKAMEKSASASEAQSALVVLLAEHDRRQEGISDRMIDRVTEWMNRCLELDGYRHDERAEFISDMEVLQTARLSDAKESLEQLTTITGLTDTHELQEFAARRDAHSSSQLGLSYRP